MDGATIQARLVLCVTDVLILALEPGDTTVMDNLSADKVRGVQEATEAAGARLLHFPAYSPDFDPIENSFAKLEAPLRTVAARTVPDLHAAIRQAFARFTPRECRNHLATTGNDAYGPA